MRIFTFAAVSACALLPRPIVAAAPLHWVGTWSAAPQASMPGNISRFDNQTIRLIVHSSVGGRSVRVRISNRFGADPLTIGAVHVAIRDGDARINPATDRLLTFNHQPAMILQPHDEATSDPVSLEVPPRSDLAVSIFLPKPTLAATTHILAKQTSYVSAPGDETAEPALDVAKKIRSWPFLTRVDVAGGPAAESLVLFGDSLVDGDGSTTDRDARWTDDLATRFQSEGIPIAVLNAGLIGNRLLRASPAATHPEIGDAFGASAVDRVRDDAFDLAGVRFILLRFGTNDLAYPGALSPASDPVDAGQVIDGLLRLLKLARQDGLTVVGTTIPPFEGAAIVPGMYSPEKEAQRLKVNSWLRSHHIFDALIDLDQILRDPGHPSRLKPTLDSGDHIHPNDAGYALMAEAFPIGLVTRHGSQKTGSIHSQRQGSRH